MNKRRFYFALSIVNAIILLRVIFYSQNLYLLISGIVLLVLYIILALFVEDEPDQFRRLKIGKYVFEYIGFEALLLGVIGLYSMLSLTKGIDILWVYYFVFNIAIILNFRFKLVSIDGDL